MRAKESCVTTWRQNHSLERRPMSGIGTINRRQLFQFASTACAVALLRPSFDLIAQTSPVTEEEQSGDPDLPMEKLEVRLDDIAPLLDTGKAINIKKDPRQFATLMLRIASQEARKPVPAVTTVEDYFKLFNVPARKADGTLQPFCAAGLSFAACQAYCDLHPNNINYTESGKLRTFRDVLSDVNKFYFLPHCSTQEMVRDAKQRGTWIDKQQRVTGLKPGWLVFFNWPDKRGNFSGVPNHVGVIQYVEQDLLHTVEYNTSIGSRGTQRNGGHIAFKERVYGNVLGYSKLY